MFVNKVLIEGIGTTHIPNTHFKKIYPPNVVGRKFVLNGRALLVFKNVMLLLVLSVFRGPLLSACFSKRFLAVREAGDERWFPINC